MIGNKLYAGDYLTQCLNILFEKSSNKYCYIGNFRKLKYRFNSCLPQPCQYSSTVRANDR